MSINSTMPAPAVMPVRVPAEAPARGAPLALRPPGFTVLLIAFPLILAVARYVY